MLTLFFMSTECSAKFGYREESDAQDGKSVSWQRTIQSVCFTSTVFLKAIMGGAYHRIIAYNAVPQEIQEKKVHPDSKLYWGAPQVVCLKWECTGTTPTIHNYQVQLQHQLGMSMLMRAGGGGRII